MSAVLDSSALIAFLRKESGSQEVYDLLIEEPCLVHALNLCEVYYVVRRESGEEGARRALETLDSLDVVVSDEMHPQFWQQAGAYKADYRKVSLADCFCVTLARRADAELVTTDHHELEPFGRDGVCRVRFIR